MKASVELKITDNGQQYEIIEITQDDIEQLAIEKCKYAMDAKNIEVYETTFTTAS
jgi:hypothetical protein